MSTTGEKKPKNQNKRKVWTKEDDVLLESLVRKGQSSIAIGKILNRTQAAIYTRKSALGLGELKMTIVKGSERRPSSRRKKNQGSIMDSVGSMSAKTGDGKTVNIKVSPLIVTEAYKVKHDQPAGNITSEPIEIPKNLLGMMIGVKGCNISRMEVAHKVSIRIDEKNFMRIRGTAAAVSDAVRELHYLLKEPNIGDEYLGTVEKIEKYGVFVRFTPVRVGLVHISSITDHPEVLPSEIYNIGDEIAVKLIGMRGDKWTLGLSDKIEESVAEVAEVLDPREITSQMTLLARRLARSSGHRMVMAIYYVEKNED